MHDYVIPVTSAPSSRPSFASYNPFRGRLTAIGPYCAEYNVTHPAETSSSIRCVHASAHTFHR